MPQILMKSCFSELYLVHDLNSLSEQTQEAPRTLDVLLCQDYTEGRVSTRKEWAVMILWFPHYKNTGGEGDIFQTSKRRCFLTQSTVSQWKTLPWEVVDDKNCHGFKKSLGKLTAEKYE